MGTVTKSIAQAVINGDYDDDKPSRVVSYNNQFDGGLTYAVIFQGESKTKYHDSPACSNVKVMWDIEQSYGTINLFEENS